MNEKHAVKLREGVAAWNEWRYVSGPKRVDGKWRSAEPRPVDLSGMDMSGMSLASADLSEANLAGVRAVETDFYKADFFRARLGGADLTGADMSKAHLCQAQFIGANLQDADLRQADISWTYVAQADFSQANLTWADLRSSVWVDVVARNALFHDALLLRFGTVGCDLTGARCRRGVYQDYGDEYPTLREFDDGEFEALYGEFCGVELCFSREVSLPTIAGLFELLRGGSRAAHPRGCSGFDQLIVEPDAVMLRFRMQRDLVESAGRLLVSDLLTWLGESTDASRVEPAPAFVTGALGTRMRLGVCRGQERLQELELIDRSHDGGARFEVIDHAELRARRQRERVTRPPETPPPPDVQGAPASADALPADDACELAMSLGRTKESGAQRVIERLARHPDRFVRHEAALSLGALGNAESVSLLVSLLDDYDDGTRWSACWALVEIWGDEAIVALRRVMSGEVGDRGMRETVSKALSEYGRTLD